MAIASCPERPNRQTLTDRLSPLPGWITAPETVRVIAALTREGATVRFCGGAVRDALIGEDAIDVDLATPDPPATVTRLAAEAGLTTRPTGIEHGTVTVAVDGRSFEVTTLRRDVETFGRKARVAFTDNWQADAARRDFTINALYADPDGRLYDYFNGIEDLAAGRVRFIGEPTQRIHEDALRILRFFRFHARFGKGEPDPASLAACRDLAASVSGLSGERIRQELFRLLTGPKAGHAVGRMIEAGILPVLLSGAINPDRLSKLISINTTPDPLLRLGSLLDRDCNEAAQRLRLSNAETRRLNGMCPRLSLAADAPAPARRRVLYTYDAERVCDAAWLSLADTGDARFRDWIKDADTWQRPTLPVGGEDAQDLGIPAGPALGAALRRIEDAWVASDFKLGREACLKLLAGSTSKSQN